MALTAQEITARKSRIGASDVASIMGLPTFKGRNAFSVWLDKTDQLEPEKKPSAAITAGNRLEPVVLDYAEAAFGTLERNVVVFDPKGGPLASTLDGRVVADGRPVEAKTSGIEGPIHGTWGEVGTDDVPDGYLIQCQTQLLCTSAEVCELVALLGGRGFCEFRIEPMDGLIAQIRAVTEDFWTRYVVPRKDPRGDWADRLRTAHGVQLECDPCEPVLETVKRYRRVTGKSILIPDPDAVIRWQAEKKTAGDADKLAKVTEAEIRAMLGDAQIGELPGGGYIERCVENGSWTYDRDAMDRDGVLDRYGKQGTREIIRIRKGK